MSFTPDIPDKDQSLGETVDDFRNNYLNYFNTISRNHVAPNKIGAGTHKFIQFVKQPNSPLPTTGKNEVALYNRLNALFFRKQSNGEEGQISGNPAFVTTGTTGFSTVMQDGNVMKFGKISATAPTVTTIDFTIVCGSAFILTPFSAKIQPTFPSPIPTAFNNDIYIIAISNTSLDFIPTLTGTHDYYFMVMGE